MIEKSEILQIILIADVNKIFNLIPLLNSVKKKTTSTDKSDLPITPFLYTLCE
jgi:hypothetical protein